MNSPLISIIVPIYNVEKYLEKCLTSLIKQNYHNLQIICINDGSPDNSALILEKYAKLDNRIVLKTQKNQGLSAARNTGLAYSKGEYIMFVDSDDWLEINCCQSAMEIALRNNYDVVFWPYNKIFANRVEKQFIYPKDTAFENINAVKNGVFKDLLGPSNEDLKHPHILDSKVTACCKLYKQSVIKNADAKFINTKEIGTEDLLFNLQVFQKVNSAFFLNTTLYNYLKVNETSLTTIFKSKLLMQWNTLHNYVRNTVNLDVLGEEYQIRFSNRIACSIIGLGLNIMNQKASFINARANILKILRDEKYEKAIDSISIKNMPFHWKLFFTCAKYKFVTPLTLLYFVIHRIILR